jgi:hypothetical protein
MCKSGRPFAVRLLTAAGGRSKTGLATMLMNIENNLCLYVNFLDELNLVRIFAVTKDWAHRIAAVGGVKGKEQLVDLLNEAEIDH